MNISSLLARATDFSNGLSTSRPITTRASRPRAAGAKASSRRAFSAPP